MNLVNVALVVGAGTVLDLTPFDRLAEYRDPLLTEGSRIALGVGLVGVALRLPHGYWCSNWRWIAGIIGVGMAVMWLTAAGLLVAVGLPLTVALLVGAMLAPTDPITTTPVVTGANAEKYVPDRVRYNLSGESGVNDGLGFLFVMLPLLLLGVAAAVFVRRFVVVWLLSPVYRHVHTRQELAFMSWFGPLGVSALYYAMDASSRLDDERLFTYVSFAIAVSVVLHGLSTVPLSKWLAAHNSNTAKAPAG